MLKLITLHNHFQVWRINCNLAICFRERYGIVSTFVVVNDKEHSKGFKREGKVSNLISKDSN